MRVGAIDIGSNSTRYLIADVVDGRVEELERDSVVTRLGDGVDAASALNAAARERTRAAFAGFAERIAAQGCVASGAIATSAVRDASNGEEFAAVLTAEFATPVKVIGGDREAELTFIGAQTGDALDRSKRSLVVDIGGGSTEFIVGAEGALEFHVSTKLGAVRQSERHLASDPPTEDELQRLLAEAQTVIEQNVPAAHREAIDQGVAVAGTPTVLAAVDQRLEQFDPWKVHGYAITRAACERMLSELAALPLERRKQVVGLHPDRAATIVAGTAILAATIFAFELDQVTVSEHDILYGCALELARGATTQ